MVECEINALKDMDKRDIFIDNLMKSLEQKGQNTVLLTRAKYNDILEHHLQVKDKGKKSPADYNILKRFEVIEVEGCQRLVRHRKKNSEEPIKFVVPMEDMYDCIEQVHVAVGHLGEKKTALEVNKIYANITREALGLYIASCNECQWRKNRNGRVQRSSSTKTTAETLQSKTCDSQEADKDLTLTLGSNSQLERGENQDKDIMSSNTANSCHSNSDTKVIPNTSNPCKYTRDYIEINDAIKPTQCRVVEEPEMADHQEEPPQVPRRRPGRPSYRSKTSPSSTDIWDGKLGALRDSAVARLLVEGHLPPEWQTSSPQYKLSASTSPAVKSIKREPLDAYTENRDMPKGVPEQRCPSSEVATPRGTHESAEQPDKAPLWTCHYCPFTARNSATMYSHYQYHQQVNAGLVTSTSSQSATEARDPEGSALMVRQSPGRVFDAQRGQSPSTSEASSEGSTIKNASNLRRLLQGSSIQQHAASTFLRSIVRNILENGSTSTAGAPAHPVSQIYQNVYTAGQQPNGFALNSAAPQGSYFQNQNQSDHSTVHSHRDNGPMDMSMDSGGNQHDNSTVDSPIIIKQEPVDYGYGDEVQSSNEAIPHGSHFSSSTGETADTGVRVPTGYSNIHQETPDCNEVLPARRNAGYIVNQMSPDALASPGSESSDSWHPGSEHGDSDTPASFPGVKRRKTSVPQHRKLQSKTVVEETKSYCPVCKKPSRKPETAERSSQCDLVKGGSGVLVTRSSENGDLAEDGLAGGAAHMRCFHCGITFDDEVLYSLHMGCHSHVDPYQCNVCGRPCGNKYAFYTHIMRGHSA